MAADAPTLTDDVARRLSSALREAAQARLAGVAGVPGNPADIQTRSFGDTVCDLSGRDLAHYPYFNGPRELLQGADVAAIAAWYRERDRPIYVRLSPPA